MNGTHYRNLLSLPLNYFYLYFYLYYFHLGKNSKLKLMRTRSVPVVDG
jgi:hypothetical protein